MDEWSEFTATVYIESISSMFNSKRSFYTKDFDFFEGEWKNFLIPRGLKVCAVSLFLSIYLSFSSFIYQRQFIFKKVMHTKSKRPIE